MSTRKEQQAAYDRKCHRMLIKIPPTDPTLGKWLQHREKFTNNIDAFRALLEPVYIQKKEVIVKDLK